MKHTEMVWDDIPAGVDINAVARGLLSILPKGEYRVACSDVIAFDGENKNGDGKRRRLEVSRIGSGLCHDQHIKKLAVYVAGIKLGLIMTEAVVPVEGDANKE